MEDVTGFNQKTTEFDGERLIEAGIKRLKACYSENMCEVIKLMMRFHEVDRPSFIELANIVLMTVNDPSTLSKEDRENLIQSPNSGRTLLPKFNPQVVSLIQKHFTFKKLNTMHGVSDAARQQQQMAMQQ
jgi:hypothetical protein